MSEDSKYLKINYNPEKEDDKLNPSLGIYFHIYFSRFPL